jgi:hypothetical protein
MCRALPCSHPALSTDHHMPNRKIGSAPLAPNASVTTVDGARKFITFPGETTLSPRATVPMSVNA